MRPEKLSITKSETMNKESYEDIVNRAERRVTETIKALDDLEIDVPERHNVLVPGKPTTAENSDNLLKKAIEESKDIGSFISVDTCPYICKFCRYYNRTGSPEQIKKMVNEDVGNLIREIDKKCNELIPGEKKLLSSLYIGGGTPTLMNRTEMKQLFGAIKDHFELTPDSEITMETTPDTMNDEKLKLMEEMGVNRVSMGVQVLNDEWLKSMNRKHTVQDVTNTLELFNQHNMRYNVDLIYGFKKQSLEDFYHDLQEILKYSPPEITLYRYESQKRTDDRDIKVEEADRKTRYIMQEVGRSVLLQAGYIENPSGWFTRKGLEKAKEYQNRWKDQKPLVSFGPEAYSYSKYQQHTNLPFHDYRKAILNNENLLDKNRVFAYIESQQKLRKMIFNLKSTFETNFDQDHESFFNSFVDADLGNITEKDGNNIFRLNEKGIIIVEEIIRILVEESEKLGQE